MSANDKNTWNYSVKLGDLVRCPTHESPVYWWSGRVGIVVDVKPYGHYKDVQILIGDSQYARFGENCLELVSESR